MDHPYDLERIIIQFPAFIIGVSGARVASAVGILQDLVTKSCKIPTYIDTPSGAGVLWKRSMNKRRLLYAGGVEMQRESVCFTAWFQILDIQLK